MNLDLIALILSSVAMTIFAYRLYWIRKFSPSAEDKRTLKVAPSLDYTFVIFRWLQTMGMANSIFTIVLFTLSAIIILSGAVLWFAPERISWLLPIIVGLVTTSVFALYVLAKSKTLKLEQELSASLPSIRAMLSSGFSLEKALQLTSQSSSKTLRKELTEIAKRLKLGLPVEKAVERILFRHNSEGVRLFTQALIAKSHTDSDLGLMLHYINELMTVRIKQRMAFTAQISSARYTAVFTAILPYLLIPLIYSQEKNWFNPIIEQEGGMTVLITALGLQLLGFVWLHRISRSYQ